MRENNQKHSAANYCSTQPAEPAAGEFAAPSHARKRPRADSGSSSIGGTPNGTPRLDPTVPRRPEPVEFAIGTEDEVPRLQPVRTPQPTKEDIFPTFGPDDTIDFKLPRPAEAPECAPPCCTLSPPGNAHVHVHVHAPRRPRRLATADRVAPRHMT